MLGLFGNWFGNSTPQAVPPISPAQVSTLFAPQRMPMNRDNIVSQIFAPPYWTPSDLDYYGGETPQMRFNFRKFYRTEPSLKAALDGTTSSLSSSETSVIPEDKDSPNDIAAAEFNEWSIEQTPRGMRGLIEDINRHARLDGYFVGEIKLHQVTPEESSKWAGKWRVDHVRVLDTIWINLELDVYRNIVAIVNTVRGLEYYDPSEVIFYSHKPLYNVPFGQSDFRATTRAANILEDVYKVWYVALKLYGYPYLIGKVKSGTRRQMMENALTALHASGYAVTDVEESIDVVNLASAASYDAFQTMIQTQREDVNMVFRGSSLPFQEGQGGNDSHGDTQVASKASDAEEESMGFHIAHTIRRQLFNLVTAINFPRGTGVPHLQLGGTNWDTTAKRVATMKDAQSMGAKIKKAWFYKETGIVPADDNDPNDALEAPKELAPDGGGMPGSGGPPGAGPQPPFGGNPASPKPKPLAPTEQTMSDGSRSEYVARLAAQLVDRAKGSDAFAEDAEGHNHGKDGKFVGKSGGSGGGGSAKPATTHELRIAVDDLTRPISQDEARALVAGKTEKPSGVDPAINFPKENADTWEYRVGHIPLEFFKDNEEGDLYDTTTNRNRAEEYSKREPRNVPPVVAVLGRKTPSVNLLDGGHRLSAARMRGDKTISAIIAVRKGAGKSFADEYDRDENGRFAPKGLSGVHAEWKRATGRTKEHLHDAYYNTVGEDPGEKPLRGRIDKKLLSRRVASAHAALHDDGGTAEELKPLERAALHAGLTKVHNTGDVTTFDPEKHVSDVGISEGTPVRVVRPGWHRDDGDGRIMRVVGAKVEPMPKQFSDWDEDKHPRAKDGKFGKGSGKAKKKSKDGDSPKKKQSGDDPSSGNADRQPVVGHSPSEAAADYKANGTKAKAFKAWFGDWENDPASASKVVKKNGEPSETYTATKVYHGTSHDFTFFDPEKLGQNTKHPTALLGTFFTEDPEIARMFTGDKLDRKRAKSQSQISHELHGKDYFGLHPQSPERKAVNDAYDAQPLENHWTPREDGAGKVIDCYLNVRNPYEMSQKEWGERFMSPMMRKDNRVSPDEMREHVKKFRKELEAKGHDGIRLEGSDRPIFNEYSAPAWIAFEPTQIKAVDNAGTFDPNDPKIKMSDTTTFRNPTTPDTANGQNGPGIPFAEDSQGHEHKGKGPGGGQFVSKGKGESTGVDDKTKDNKNTRDSGNTKKNRLPKANHEAAKKVSPPKSKAARTPVPKLSKKAAAAVAKVPKIDASVQRYAEEYNEPRVAALLGGASFPDSEPCDIKIPADPAHTSAWTRTNDEYRHRLQAWKDGGQKGVRPVQGELPGDAAHLVELKTMTVGKGGGIDMNAYAIVRKVIAEKESGAPYHTIACDHRRVYSSDGKHQMQHEVYYYRRGFGNAEVERSMYRCSSIEEVIALMNMPEEELPEKARRRDEKWRKGRWVPLKDERGYKNVTTGQIVRPKK